MAHPKFHRQIFIVCAYCMVQTPAGPTPIPVFPLGLLLPEACVSFDLGFLLTLSVHYSSFARCGRRLLPWGSLAGCPFPPRCGPGDAILGGLLSHWLLRTAQPPSSHFPMALEGEPFFKLGFVVNHGRLQ